MSPPADRHARLAAAAGLRRGLAACGCVVVAACFAAGAAAQTVPPGTDIAAAKARVMAERKRLLSAYAAEEARCSERFAMTACVDDVRRRRREALAEPRAQVLDLDDADRRERAEARRLAVQEKQRKAAASTAAASAAVPRAEEPELGPVTPAGPAASTASGVARKPVAPRSSPGARRETAGRTRDGAAAAAQAGRRVEEAQARKETAEAVAERIRRRQEERDRRSKKSPPLAVPSAASQPVR